MKVKVKNLIHLFCFCVFSTNENNAFENDMEQMTNAITVHKSEELIITVSPATLTTSTAQISTFSSDSDPLFHEWLENLEQNHILDQSRLLSFHKHKNDFNTILTHKLTLLCNKFISAHKTILSMTPFTHHLETTFCKDDCDFFNISFNEKSALDFLSICQETVAPFVKHSSLSYQLRHMSLEEKFHSLCVLLAKISSKYSTNFLYMLEKNFMKIEQKEHYSMKILLENFFNELQQIIEDDEYEIEKTLAREIKYTVLAQSITLNPIKNDDVQVKSSTPTKISTLSKSTLSISENPFTISPLRNTPIRPILITHLPPTPKVTIPNAHWSKKHTYSTINEINELIKIFFDIMKLDDKFLQLLTTANFHSFSAYAYYILILYNLEQKIGESIRNLLQMNSKAECSHENACACNQCRL